MWADIDWPHNFLNLNVSNMSDEISSADSAARLWNRTDHVEKVGKYSY